MRITKNTSVLQTKAIKHIAQQVYLRHFRGKNPDFKRAWKRFEIEVLAAKNTKPWRERGYTEGTCAALYGYWVRLMLKPKVDPAELAGLMHHEFFHAFYHVHHKDFPELIQWSHINYAAYTWANTYYGPLMPLRPSGKCKSTRTLLNAGGALEKFRCDQTDGHKGKHSTAGFDLDGYPKTYYWDVVSERHARVVRRLAVWERRLKVAQRKVREYSARKRAYERRGLGRTGVAAPEPADRQ